MAQIIALCQKHKVLELYVFGSVLTDKFNKRSDVDFVVIFDKPSLPLLMYGDNYFEFKFALEDLLKRDVDLIEYNAVNNPYFKEELDETKKTNLWTGILKLIYLIFHRLLMKYSYSLIRSQNNLTNMART